jgi:hypothetical protein
LNGGAVGRPAASLRVAARWLLGVVSQWPRPREGRPRLGCVAVGEAKPMTTVREYVQCIRDGHVPEGARAGEGVSERHGLIFDGMPDTGR